MVDSRKETAKINYCFKAICDHFIVDVQVDAVNALLTRTVLHCCAQKRFIQSSTYHRFVLDFFELNALESRNLICELTFAKGTRKCRVRFGLPFLDFLGAYRQCHDAQNNTSARGRI